MKKLEQGIYGVALLAAIGGMICALVDPHFFEWVYVREDGVIESGTALALLLGSLLTFRRFFRLRALRAKPFLIVTLLCALTFLFGAGEEISWGQRIFDLKTPEALEKINAQGELNFHNIKVGEVKLNKLIFSQLLGLALIFYFLALPFLYRKSERWRKFSDTWGIPIPQDRQILLYLGLTIFVSLIPHQRKWELLEFVGCMVFWSILLIPKNAHIFSLEESSTVSSK